MPFSGQQALAPTPPVAPAATKPTGGAPAAEQQRSKPLPPNPLSPPVSSASMHYDASRDIVLRHEHFRARDAKNAILLVWMVVVAGMALLGVAIYYKASKSGLYFLQNDMLPTINIVFGSICGVALLVYWLVFIRRVQRSNSSGKRWSHRRRRLTGMAGAELTLQLTSIVFFIAPNAYVLAHECGWFAKGVIWSAIVSWTCINTILLLYWIEAHSNNPAMGRWRAVSEAGMELDSDPMAAIIDAPLWMHWPKLGLWLAMEAVMLALALETVEAMDRAGFVPDPAITDCHQQQYTCRGGQGTPVVLLSLLVVCVNAYVLAWTLAMRRAYNNLLRTPYNQFKRANMVIRMQIRLRSLAMAFYVLCMVCYTFVHISTCSSFVLSWLGYLPMQLVLSFAALTSAHMMTPKRPQDTGILQVWLQEFAWTEADVPRKCQERASSLPPDSANTCAIDREPMFCFETAMKMLYWSFLVYDYQEVPGTPFNLEDAQLLYDLEHFELFWEKSLDTKVLVAWNSNTVVIAFRGTASLANVKSDMQVWRTRWPLMTGSPLLFTAPMVHQGFHRAWTGNTLNDRLIDWLQQLLLRLPGGAPNTAAPGAAPAPRPPVNVLVTGHSLGGALATLCAYDIARLLPEEAVRVKCYTFGAPRTGNYAFAREYNAAVPDTWHVINNSDAVTRGGKFFVLYKRPGQRVIVNRLGDLLVRPSYVETASRQLPGELSVRDHMLTQYKLALAAVLEVQFSPKSFQHGRAGVLRLAQQKGASVLLQTAGLSVGALDVLQHQGWDTYQQLRKARRSAPQVLPWRRKAVQQQALLAEAERQEEGGEQQQGQQQKMQDGSIGKQQEQQLEAVVVDAQGPPDSAAGGGVVQGPAAEEQLATAAAVAAAAGGPPGEAAHVARGLTQGPSLTMRLLGRAATLARYTGLPIGLPDTATAGSTTTRGPVGDGGGGEADAIIADAADDAPSTPSLAAAEGQ